MALRWSARMDTNFSIDMLLRWSKEVSLQTKTSSRQRRDISYVAPLEQRGISTNKDFLTPEA